MALPGAAITVIKNIAAGIIAHIGTGPIEDAIKGKSVEQDYATYQNIVYGSFANNYRSNILFKTGVGDMLARIKFADATAKEIKRLVRERFVKYWPEVDPDTGTPPKAGSVKGLSSIFNKEVTPQSVSSNQKLAGFDFGPLGWVFMLLMLSAAMMSKDKPR